MVKFDANMASVTLSEEHPLQRTNGETHMAHV